MAAPARPTRLFSVPALTAHEPRLVAGKYRLTRLLGRGGMGTVWEGVHTTLGTRVAVKFIDAEYAQSTEARSRFENEARAAAALRSKHVVEIHDHGVGEDGCPFIVMEYLEGETLDQKLDRVVRISPQETALIIHQVCRALAKAHAAGIVHRDLKPENIFLVWDEEDQAIVVKVLDFGIAKFTNQQLGASSSATRTGSVLGTPFFMSPEQARGLRSVDHRTDVWSLGVIAYRCIVGELPFEGEAIGDLLVRLCTEPIRPPSSVRPDVPEGFDAFIERALAREVENRFQSVQELSEALGEVCGLPARPPLGSFDLGFTPEPPHIARSVRSPAHALATGAPTTWPAIVFPWVRNRRMILGVALGGLALVGGAIVLFARSGQNAEPVPPSAATSAPKSAIAPTAPPGPEPSAEATAPESKRDAPQTAERAEGTAETEEPPKKTRDPVSATTKKTRTRPAAAPSGALPRDSVPPPRPRKRPIDLGY